MPKLLIFLFCLSLYLFPSNSKAQTFYAPNGGPFTSKGDFRILVIFAGLKSQCNTSDPLYNDSNWPQERQGFPQYGTFLTEYQDLFYSSYDQFSTTATDRTLSNFFYQSTNHHPKNSPFRIVADYFPERINIDGNNADNTKVFAEIQRKYPNFDWSKYDNRTNNPNFLKDNSNSLPDHKLDYVVVIWRQQGLGGYANTNYYTFTTTIKDTVEKYQVDYNCGFTIVRGVTDVIGIRSLFLHELSHSLFNSPHVFGANEISGSYFYYGMGWGMMHYGIVNSCPNAWESWYNGWIELPPNKDLSSYIQNGTYTLRDFITTGDALRIKLPFCNQYLWIENHTNSSAFDKKETFTADGNGRPIPDSPPGLYMYVEALAADRSIRLNALSIATANGMKAMAEGGNNDYSIINYASDPLWWNNHVVNFSPTPNPTSAHNGLTKIRANYPFETQYPDKIVYRDYTNNPSDRCLNKCGAKDCMFITGIGQEAQEIVRKDSILTYEGVGTNAAFGSTAPRKIDISSNPVIINHQKYDQCKEQLEPIYLNGISLNITSIAPEGDRIIEVRFDETSIYIDQRFTGNLLLKDIPNAKYDLNIEAGKILTVNKSGTPNRHTQGANNEFPDFINPSILTIDSGAHVLIDNGAVLNITEGSTLVIKAGATITLKGSGKIKVDKNSYYYKETGAVINLTDKKSKIQLSKSTKEIINPLLNIK